MSTGTDPGAKKLSPELKAKWLEALRSGDYAQGTGALCVLREGGRDEYEHCCLGVLAEVAGIERECIRGKCHLGDIGNTLLGDFDDGVEYTKSLPETHTTIQRKLAGMNDNGMTFPEIADWIEANL